MIVATFEGSPAQKAGLRLGDIIVVVDGQPVMDVTDAVTRIRGPAGASVALTIQDAAGATRTVTIVRAKVNLASVSWNELPGTSIAQLQVSSFDSVVTAALDAALSAIKAKGATGII